MTFGSVPEALRSHASLAPDDVAIYWTPLEHHVLGHMEDAVLEHWPHPVREPIVQLDALSGIVKAFDAEANFCERDDAHIEALDRLARDEGDDPAIRLRPAKLGEHVRIEQPVGHGNGTSRTGMGERSTVRSISR